MAETSHDLCWLPYSHKRINIFLHTLCICSGIAVLNVNTLQTVEYKNHLSVLHVCLLQFISQRRNGIQIFIWILIKNWYQLNYDVVNWHSMSESTWNSFLFFLKLFHSNMFFFFNLFILLLFVWLSFINSIGIKSVKKLMACKRYRAIWLLVAMEHSVQYVVLWCKRLDLILAKRSLTMAISNYVYHLTRNR